MKAMRKRGFADYGKYAGLAFQLVKICLDFLPVGNSFGKIRC